MTKFRSGLGANALGLATLLVAMAAAPAFTQVQVNSPGSSLTINGRTGDGFGGQLVFPIAAADILTIEIAGEPYRPCGLVVGVRDEFGFNFGPPYGNLHVNPFIVLVDGFAGPGTATYNTNAAGSFVTLDQLAYLPVGFRATLQAYVGTVSGPVLSGPIEFIRVPGDPVPSSLVVGQRNPSFSAGNRHGILADVNNDGDLDWIGSAGIFVGDGNFGFSYLAIDPGGVETAVADLVGDSNLDLVVLDEVFNGLKVFAGNGTGNFVGNPTTQLPVICKDAGDVAIVDLDGDGDNDLIVCDGGTVSPGVTRFDNIAGGLFLVGTNAIDDAYTIATGDYNGDGFLDWAIGGTTNGTDETRILWGSASGSWTVFNSTVIGGLPEAAAHWLRARDMDGDGDLDLLYAGASQNGVLINDGSGNFSLSPIATTSSPGLPNPRLDAVDFDQDGDLDVVHLVRPGPQSYCVVEVNNGNTQFTKSWYLPLRGSPSTPASGGYCLVADLDGDGDDDIAAGGYPSTILVNDN